MTPPDAQDFDALLRDRLDREAERIDPRPLFARIMVPPAPPPPRPWRRSVGGFAVAAAVGGLLVGGLMSVSPAEASARDLVQQAQRTHLQPIDRCYLVEVRPESELFDDAKPAAAASRTTRLWTRGDRFWIESADPTRRWAWGRDEQGGMWISFGGLRKGVRVAADETPPWLDRACEVFAMRLDTLLAEVLRDFDLTAEPGEAGTRVLAAALKPGGWHPALRSARLDIDPETRAVRGLVLHRTRFGRPLATAAYTLVETRPQDDAKYQIAGHLPDGAEVYTRDHHPGRRAELLARWFGAVAAQP